MILYPCFRNFVRRWPNTLGWFQPHYTLRSTRICSAESAKQMWALRRVCCGWNHPRAFGSTTWKGSKETIMYTFTGEKIWSRSRPGDCGAPCSMRPWSLSKGRTGIERLCAIRKQIESWRCTRIMLSVESSMQRTKAALDVRVEKFGVVKALNITVSKELHLRTYHSQYHLTARSYPDHTGHNDFEVRKVGAEGSSCWFLNLNPYIF